MEKTKILLHIAIVFIFGLAMFGNCRSDRKIAYKLYKERDYLLKEFRNKSIINRGKQFYQLSYYKEQSVNTFFFERNDGLLNLTSDSLEYDLIEIAPFTSEKSIDSSNYKTVVTKELGRLIKVMDSLEISNVSSAFSLGGIDMKIYLGDYKALLYVRDINLVNNEAWRNYIKSGEMLDENWYYVKDELSE